MNSILTAIAGPGFIFALRYLAPIFLKNLPSFVQPVVAGLIGVCITLATGEDPTLSITTLVEALQAFVMTGGVVKILDMFKNRSDTVKPAVKRALETNAVKDVLSVVMEPDEFADMR